MFEIDVPAELKECNLVLLSNRGNPDYVEHQNPNEPIYGTPPDQFVIVESIDKAQKLCMQYIRALMIGEGQWSGGDFISEGVHLGRISFFGRLQKDAWGPLLRADGACSIPCSDAIRFREYFASLPEPEEPVVVDVAKVGPSLGC